MKILVTIFTLCIAFPITIAGQSLNDINFIAPFSDGLAAVKKEDMWAFIDQSGETIIDYRDDLVLTSFKDQNYPVFNSGRCLIMKKVDGISYFGYIDKTGKTVLEPQYLNATNFNKGIAIVLKLHKTNLGKNDILDKNMIDYSYSHLAINPQGEAVYYLSDKPKHITLSRDYAGIPPKIRIKFISKKLIAIQNENKSWTIKKIDDSN